MIFVIPWRDFSLVGTTDTDFDGDPDRLWATRDEVTYLLDDRRPGPARPPRRRSTTSPTPTPGVRPLSFEAGALGSEGLARAQGDRRGSGRALPLGHRHQAHLLPEPRRGRGRPGDARARPPRARGRRGSPSTAPTRRRGRSRRARGWTCRRRWRRPGLGRETLETLVETYGRGTCGCSSWRRSCPTGRSGSARRTPRSWPSSTTRCSDELAVSLQDVLLRRTGIGQSRCQGLDCAEPIGRAWPSCSGWSPRRLDAELDAYRQHVARSPRFRER